MIQICRGFTDKQWEALRKRLIQQDGAVSDEKAWRCAVEVFERRIRERFLSCIDALERNDSRSDISVPDKAPADCLTLPEDGEKQIVVPGFAIMALCCLLIDTLQSFREAAKSPSQASGPCAYPAGPCIRPQPSTTEAFKKFLRLPAFRGEFARDKVASSFVRGVRNGILHEAETRRWVIWRNRPQVRLVQREGRGYALNRTAFYQALKSEFEEYLRELGNPEKIELRRRFLKKMNDIVKES